MENYIVIIPGIIISILVFTTIFVYTIIMLVSQRNLKKGKKVFIDKNLNGNKIAHYIFNKYEIDTEVLIDKKETSEKSNYNVYNRDLNKLFLSRDTYQTKSLSAQAIVLTECARTMVDKKDDCYTPKYMKLCFSLLLSFILLAIVIYFTALQTTSIGMQYVLLLLNTIAGVLILSWYMLVNKNEKKVKITINEILNTFDYYTDQEKNNINKLIKDYARITLIRKNKVELKLKSGGNYEK